ncbi:hypothetical protein [Flavicella sp.]|uniref:hypothetical protein n=1 Tax=Flavicella sp. TaxID=2957742 RepID=UPI0030163B47
MTLTNAQPKCYPGLLSDSVEFFAVEGGLKFLSSGKVEAACNMPYHVAKLAEDKIKSEKDTSAALKDWYPNSEFDQVLCFYKCRYGGLDFVADIENNELQEGDYWDCPARKTCKYNGIICKPPTVNGIELTSFDVQLLKLLSTSATNEKIAFDLQIPFGSLHKPKQALYEKFKVQTRQELTIKTRDLNII